LARVLPIHVGDPERSRSVKWAMTWPSSKKPC